MQNGGMREMKDVMVAIAVAIRDIVGQRIADEYSVPL